MDKRYLKWILLSGVVAIIAAQFYVRPELRSLFSYHYWDNLLRYGRVMRLVEAEYVDGKAVDFKAFTDHALREAVAELDDYTSYFTADEYERFNQDANQVYVGVGIEVGYFSGRTVIADVFEQGSAGQAGIHVGDFIVGVDGEDLREADMRDIVKQIRGEPGTAVTLEIVRPLEAEPLFFTMERRSIALDSVIDVRMESESIGYLRIRQFIDATDVELLDAMHDLSDQGMQSLVIDLRGNPGGRLDTAARMAEFFLDAGDVILTVQSRRGGDEVFRVRKDIERFEIPIVILIDGLSASASEIFSGALRDHQRAVLVGAKSYGKGSVQSVYGFTDGDGLKLTSARYLLPGGETINGIGVEPDVAVEISEEDRILRLLQEHHLRRMDADAFEQTFGFAPVGDATLETALALLKAE